MEGDYIDLGYLCGGVYFNPLPPHGGRPLVGTCCLGVGCNFNPLPPHGGRHNMEVMQNGNYLYFNPLPPHGGRPCVHLRHYLGTDISIHSLRMEGDLVGFSVP